MTAIGLVLLFLLTLRRPTTARCDEHNYAWLFGVNVLVAVLLAGRAACGWRRPGLRLMRKGRFGSRLLVELAAIFGLVGLVRGC